MSSKGSAAKGSKKKLDENENPASAKTPKVKLPRSFITRPSPNVSFKSMSKVYLHSSILKAHEIAPGSFINVTKEGENEGILALAAAADQSCPFNVIQVSQVLRSISNILLGDRLEISRATTQPSYAITVTIGTTSGTKLDGKVKKSVEKLLDDVGIITPGMKFKFGIPSDDKDGEETYETLIITEADALDLENLQIDDNITENNSTQLIAPSLLFKKGETSVMFTDSTEPNPKYTLPKAPTYSQVGGLSAEIELLKSTIELPLHQPTLFSDFGVTPPRGILLHGPPGTGKTMLLRAVAAEANAHVLTINGPSIISKYLGESESALRDIFVEAKKYQPSIVFIDEIDSLAPSRNSDDSGEVESRIVATLLTLMDGVGDSGRLVVVAATNRPNSIDSALRRPGRFDQEVEIGIPDVEARLDILKLQFSKMQHRHSLKDDDIFNIASRTHGYVGADLIALCRESVMKTIQRGLKKAIKPAELKVETDDVEEALPEIRPSAMREIFLEMPKVYWSDIGGQEDLKQKLKEMIQLPLEAADAFRRLGVSAPKGVLLYGPPGCSKTLTAKALATESGVNFLAVKGPEIFNKYVGESEKAIREIFRKARAASPSIIFFDEIDALSPDRSEGGTTAAASHVLTSMLNEIDGVEELKGVVIVAATNRPTEIDPALLRPGRLDRHVYVGPPDFEARLQIFKNSTRKMAIDSEEVDLEELAEATEGCSGAEVVLVCQEAGLAAIMENSKAEKVSKKHFEKALSEFSRGITSEMLEYYEEFAERSGLKA
jgi:AAA family ATPase